LFLIDKLQKDVNNRLFTGAVNNALRVAFVDRKKELNMARARKKAFRAEQGEEKKMEASGAVRARGDYRLSNKVLCCVCGQGDVIDWINCGNEDCVGVCHFLCFVVKSFQAVKNPEVKN
jgi:hypothetical protein